MDELDMEELDLTEVEREICRLPDVSIARLVAEADGRVTEVHVVAHPGKHPKQIVRDVQSIALAVVRARARSPRRLGGATRRRRPPTTRCSRAASARRSSRSRPRSTVCASSCGSRWPATTRRRSASPKARSRQPPATGSSRLRRSTRCASSNRPPSASTSSTPRSFGSARTTSPSSRSCSCIPPAEQLVSGSAIVRPQQEADAVARAVLDATNRRLAYVIRSP